ncbi:MAG: hypothetical protein ACLUE8_03480 [Lachnospiraceae bacterium]
MLPANFFQPGQFFLQTDLVQVPPVLDAVIVGLQGFLSGFLGLFLGFFRLVPASAATASADAFPRAAAQSQSVQQRQRRLCHGDQPVQRLNRRAGIHVDASADGQTLLRLFRPPNHTFQFPGDPVCGAAHALFRGGDRIVQPFHALAEIFR